MFSPGKFCLNSLFHLFGRSIAEQPKRQYLVRKPKLFLFKNRDFLLYLTISISERAELTERTECKLIEMCKQFPNIETNMTFRVAFNHEWKLNEHYAVSFTMGKKRSLSLTTLNQSRTTKTSAPIAERLFT